MSDSKNYIPASMVVCGLGCGIYGFYHPNEESCLKLSRMKPTIVTTFKDYKDSFNMYTAENALQDGKISKTEFEKLKNVFDNLSNVLQKEEFVENVLNTPYEQRTISYKSAIRDANKARPKLWKSLFCLTSDFQDKLSKLEILDKEKFTEALSAAKKRLKDSYKELSKGGLKGLAVGLALGFGIGAFLNRVAKDNH